MKISKHTALEAVKWGAALSPWVAVPLMFGRAGWLAVPWAVYTVAGGIRARCQPAYYSRRGDVQQAVDLPLLVVDDLAQFGDLPVGQVEPGRQDNVLADLSV